MNNICNKLISPEQVNLIINSHLKIPVTIKDISLFRRAFMHKSFSIRDDFIDKEDSCCMFNFDKSANASNERLEFFGDSCINLVTAEYLFDKYPDKDEGFLTKLRTKLVRNTQLAYLGDKLGFREWLLISTHVEKILGRTNDRLIEDVFESFIAAMYKDVGFYQTREFIYSCYNTYINLDKLSNSNDNYKDILLRFFQINGWNHPVYEVIQTGTKQNREFTALLHVDSNLARQSHLFETIQVNHNKIIKKYNLNSSNQIIYIEADIGKTKKESEQNVSKKSMQILEIPCNF